jgi:toxin YoeB
MGKYKIILKPIAENHLSAHKNAGNKVALRKIQSIFMELEIHPFTGTGQPEPLRYELTGFWSRRINQKDRLIYMADEENKTIYILSALGHYENN